MGQKKPNMDEQEDEEEYSMEENNQPEYKEKIWTRDDGTIDGYTFRGKKTFAKALAGVRGIMAKKGVSHEIDIVKYKPMDSKEQAGGLEIDVEITFKNQRGIAILKIYGPKEDIKKDNTITITKSKTTGDGKREEYKERLSHQKIIKI